MPNVFSVAPARFDLAAVRPVCGRGQVEGDRHDRHNIVNDIFFYASQAVLLLWFLED
jgi:hypothetical protein